MNRLKNTPASQACSIGPASRPEDLLAFRTLNEEWITRFFTLEETDRQQLGDPVGQILAPGGQIFVVHLDGQAVGCVALRPDSERRIRGVEDGRFSSTAWRGIGRRLLTYTIEQARRLGANRLILGSSTKLGSAVHLYEQLGFRHLPPERRPELAYSRADVFMELDF